MSMNKPLAGVALVCTVVAMLLSARSQTFTYVVVDGRTIRMLVAGTGPATVVFENGLNGPLEHWGKVQPHVSLFARTVTYDRAGVGLSEGGPPLRDGREIARELHDALGVAGVPPPYILAGHSLGGLYIRVFAGMYPDDVSGMVLVDPTHDGDDLERSVLPELAALPRTVEQARTSRIPPHVPLILIDAIGLREIPFATGRMREARARQRGNVEADSRTYKIWVDDIPGARLVVTEQSGHNVPQEQPELVIETIRQVVQQSKGI
jgi:pimeloyl-ACP methyl ester carboxylesterase